MAIWNDERTELCKTLWADGYTATQVASRIGGVSRNAVIGKIHRLGLANTRPRFARLDEVRLKRARPKKAPRPVSDWLTVSGQGLAYVSKRTEPGALPPEPPRPAKLVSFEDLTDKTCRFIYGDPKGVEWGYCTCEKAPGSSFCAGHHAKVFNGATVRLRKTTADIGMWSKMMPAEFEVMS